MSSRGSDDSLGRKRSFVHIRDSYQSLASANENVQVFALSHISNPSPPQKKAFSQVPIQPRKITFEDSLRNLDSDPHGHPGKNN